MLTVLGFFMDTSSQRNIRQRDLTVNQNFLIDDCEMLQRITYRAMQIVGGNKEAQTAAARPPDEAATATPKCHQR